MIDVHSHIIPKIDDGSCGLEETYEMLKNAKEAGFTDIITTPHYIEGVYNVNSAKKNEIIEKLNVYSKEKNMNIHLYSGSEIYITLNMLELLEKNEAQTLANSKYVLFEIPMNNNIVYLEECIFKLKSKGYIPVIAHPERYKIVQQNPELVKDWINRGAYMQCNYLSIIGKYGNKAKKILKKLLKSNLVHFLGSDAHKAFSYTQIGKCIKKIEKYIGKEKLEELSTNNPLCIINNEDIID